MIREIYKSFLKSYIFTISFILFSLSFLVFGCSSENTNTIADNSSSSGASSDSGKPSDSSSDSGGSSSGSQKEPDWVLTKMTTEYNLSTDSTVNIDGENVEYNKYISETIYNYDYYNDSRNCFWTNLVTNKYYLNDNFKGESLTSETKIEYKSQDVLSLIQKVFSKYESTSEYYLSSLTNIKYMYYNCLAKSQSTNTYDSNGYITNTTEYFNDITYIGLENGFHKYKTTRTKIINNGVEDKSGSSPDYIHYLDDFGKIIKVEMVADSSNYNSTTKLYYIYGKFGVLLGQSIETKIFYISENEMISQSSTLISIENIELLKETDSELVYSYNYYQTDINGVKTLTYKQTKTFTKM